jgi:hypothetical protein
MSRSCRCGCCAGIGAATPQPEINSPGQTALRYRVGTYATFYETMLARLSNLVVEVPSPDRAGNAIYYPLKNLTTRAPDDPSIALLDAFAIVGDVLTFYQERIANEGYLPTAIERRSIQELGNLIGYRFRPGVSASVYLAFTVAADFKGDIPKGTRAQSIPGAGELPQFFETSDVLDARAEWNALKPRLTRPQLVSPAGSKSVTAAETLDAVYLVGTSTNLKVNDPLLFVLGDSEGLQTMRKIEAVEPQDENKRTLIIFPPVGDLALFALKAEKLFAGSDLAAEVADILNKFIDSQSNTPGTTVSAAETQAALAQKQALAESRNFTRLATLIRHATETIRNMSGADVDLKRLEKTQAILPIAGLLKITNRLALPASVQPANPVRLGRSIETTFSTQSDIAPRLISEFMPAAAPLLYRAWTNIVKPADRLHVHALRVRAGFFASSYPGPATVTTTKDGTSTTSFPPSLGIKDTWKSLVNDRTGGPPSAVALDTTYDRIKPGSWVVIDRPELDKKKPPRALTYHRVTDVVVSGMDTGTGFTAKVTLLTLDPQWLADIAKQDNENDLPNILESTAVLRDTVVYAQSEPLALAEEPLDADVSGDTIDFHEVLDGLEAGRWLIVSGERTDVPGVSGVTASELVMLAGVSQGTDATYGKDEISVDVGKLHTQLKFATALAYTYDAATVTIYGNVANATNGQTVGEVLGDGDGSVAFQSTALRQTPLTFVSAPTADGAASTLVARVNDIAWHETDSFAAAGPRERLFVTRTDDADKTTLVFGNGVHGARLPTGTANIKATYRYGIGKAGNVKANQISQLATHPLGLQGVINPIAASGGADRDGVEAGRKNAPLALMALDRLVSVRDYADFARTYAGIGKASAARLSDGRRQLVHLTIAGVDDIPILETSDLHRNLLASLEDFGDPHLPVQLCTRKVRLLVMSAAVALLPDYAFEFVEPKIRAALLEHFGFETRDLGESAFLSEAVAVVQSVEGVAYVDFRVFDSIGEDIDAEALAALGSSLALKPYVVAEGAKLNPDFDPAKSDDPCDQVLPAELAYLTPVIPDMLILTEAGK